MTDVTASIFVRRTPGATAYTVYILIAFATVLGKIYPGTEHTANVSVPLVETLLYDGIDKWTTVEQHSFIGLRYRRTRGRSWTSTG